MPQRFDITRRDLLKTATGLLLLAPLLRARSLNAQNASPRRLVLFFTPDSAPASFWPMTGGGAQGFTLNPSMKDFMGLEEHLLFIRSLHHTFTSDNHHVAGIVQAFTGQPHDNTEQKFALGPSLDQVLIPTLWGNTPKKDIHLGVDDNRTDSRHIISYSGKAQPIVNQIRPAEAFKDIFNGATFAGGAPASSSPAPAAMPVSPAADEAAQLSRKVDAQMLAIASDELRSMQKLLGAEEQQKLDLHLTSITELAQQIQSSGATVPGMNAGGVAMPTTPGSAPVYAGGECAQISTSGTFNLNSTASLDAWTKLQSDIITAAFQCDRTRIASLCMHFSGAHLPKLMPEKLSAAGASWHDDVAHQASTQRALYDTFHQYHAGKVAYLANRLKSIQDVDGNTVLDNTLIVWTFEVGTDHNHSPKDMPYLLIGGRNIGFKTGQFLKNAKSQPAQMLHTAILNGFGVDAMGFGELDGSVAGKPACGALPGVLK